MCIYSIYRITNRINGQVYIGFDSNWPQRLITHRCASKYLDTKFYRAIRKYGWDNFVWEAIYQSYDLDHTLKIMEPLFIQEYDSFHCGYNSTLGGEGVFGYRRIMSEEEKRYRSSILKGIPKSADTRQRMKNKVFSESHRENLSKAAKARGGRPRSPETKQKMSSIMSGRVHTKVTCPHCGKEGGGNAMKQWHFDRCPRRSFNSQSVPPV